MKPMNHAKRRRNARIDAHAARHCLQIARVDGHYHRCGMRRGHEGPHLISGRKVVGR